MHARFGRSCEDPDAEAAKHARRSAATALGWSDRRIHALPCRIPRRERGVPVDDRQARPAPAREKRFHADRGPRRVLRDLDEPIASMLE
jgi:hypothetical protein